MLAKIESICGPLSPELLSSGRHSHHFYTCSRHLYERDAASNAICILQPTRSSISAQLPPGTDPLFIDFLEQLLQPDPAHRLTADQALSHPWLAVD
jgi:serine/threonine protein kinase